MSTDQTAVSRLRPNVLGLTHLVFASASYMAPAMSLFFTTSVLAGIAGVQIPFIYILSAVGIIATGSTLAQFSKKVPSAGSFQTFIARGLGPMASSVSSIVLLVGYIFLQGGVITIFGSWTHDLLVRWFAVNIPWQVLSFIGTLLFGYLMVRGVKISIQATVTLFLFEVVIILLLGFVILFREGSQAITMTPFAPQSLSSANLGAIMFGIVYGAYSFIGFEGAASFAEEAKNPHKTLPLAIFSALILIGIVYAFSTWTTILGFGVTHMKDLAGNSAPYDTLGRIFLGPLRPLVDLAGFTSISANVMAAGNANLRILFNCGREGILPKGLGLVHSRHQTPWVAIWAFLGLCLALSVFFSTWWSALTVYAVISGFGAILAILVYLVVNISLIRFYHKYWRQEFSAWRHAIVPIIGTIVWLLPLYGSLAPGQSFPYNTFPVDALVLIILAWIYAAYIARKDPVLAMRVGSIISGSEPTD